MKTPIERASTILPATSLSRASLRERGLSRPMIEQAVRAGALLRLRRDRYAEPDLPAALIGAGRLGGRLDCVSLVAAIGVFVRASPGTHLQFTPGSTRFLIDRTTPSLIGVTPGADASSSPPI